ncbi:TonB-dependent siderophore receptor [Halomonas elongata]|uniref:TonB-dependent siderophore receptor n=1 Tax=Halomonas elongata TaxID=2746 RepID=UPI002E2BAC4D|nr:TonB-dependent siderophore receptor [Halomonas elongata]WVI71801.1 TonB-dependent siderophore receptor [Halomonas elongata]
MTDSKSTVGRNATRLRWSRSTITLLCGTTLVVPLSVNAQEASTVDDDGQETYRLAPIIVNAQAIADDNANTTVARELWMGGKVATSIHDTPASVSVITEKEIEQRDADNTEEVLQYTPGVLTGYWGTDNRNDYYKIRGFDATTYRDGMTLGSMRGVREEPYAYERVEVLRGANSTLFGPAAPGGSINFVSKRPKFERFGEGYLGYGSFDHREAGIDVGNTLNADRTLAYRFTGKVQDSDREYDYSKNDKQFFMGGLTWEPTAYTTATVIFDYLKRDNTPNSGGYPFDKEYDRSNFFGEPDYNFHDVERSSITGMLTHDFDNGLTLRGNLRYSDLTDDYGYVYITDSVGRTGTMVDRGYIGRDREAQEVIGNAILQYDTSVGPVDSSTLGGIEYSDSSSKTTSVYAPGAPIDVSNPAYQGVPSSLTPYSANDQDNRTRSVFLTQNLSFYDHVIVTVGVRNDSMDLSSKDIMGTTASDDISETSYRGALTYKITDEVSTYYSYVESIAPPTIGVRPERGKQHELGMKYAPLGMNALFSAAVYELNKDNVSIAVVQGDGTIEQETIGESRVRGFDLEAKAELTDNLSLTGGYSYMDQEVIRGTLQDGTSIEGNKFATAPKQTASLWTHYSLPDTGASFGLGARYVDSYYFDAANTSKSESATLFDASFGYQFTRNADLAVNVSNLLDKQYVVNSGTANFYNTGREIKAKVSYRW